MPNSSEHRSSVGDCLSAVIFLSLLTLADSLIVNALPITIGPEPPQTPGFWNQGTSALIVSILSEMIGQSILLAVTYRYGSHYALKLNSLSIFIIAALSLAALSGGPEGCLWLPAITGLFRVFGGGSHATLFLTIILIRQISRGSIRAAAIYATGSFVVIQQSMASAFTPYLVGQNPALPYLISMACCIVAGVIAITSDVTQCPACGRLSTSDSTTRQPLLLHVVKSQAKHCPRLQELCQAHAKAIATSRCMARKVLKYLALVSFLAAIAKATRPLFTTYIQHRVGVTPEFATKLWYWRAAVSSGIFMPILPLTVVIFAKYTSLSPNAINLWIAKFSIIFIAKGALLIGLSLTHPQLFLGLLVNTLGVATDLALLAFAADVVPTDIASCFFLAMAQIESAGTLVGIWALYPLYQLSLDDKTLLGGAPYYVCAGLFAIGGITVWQMKPLFT
ncbi:hypothetical protein F4808DRAFT_60979 [Astrocystis sublimbata]|nr:hypothetical protein F4808DRAFT_60979 [Astrocystis sublimbata]